MADLDKREDTMSTQIDERLQLLAHQDDCLLAMIDGRPVPAGPLRLLPPWRACMIARVAALVGAPIDDGTTLEGLIAEARDAGGAGQLSTSRPT